MKRIRILLPVLVLVAGIFLACFMLAKGPTDSDEPSNISTEPSVDLSTIETVEIPQDAVADISVLSDDTYLATPGTEDISFVSETGCAMYVNNTLILFAQRGTTRDAVAAVAEKYDGSIVGEIGGMDIYQICLDGVRTHSQLQELVAQIETEDCIQSASVDYLIENQSSEILDDPWCDSGYTKFDNGQTTVYHNDAENNLWGIYAIGADKAWEHLDQMETVNVAVVEGAIDEDHEDLNIAGILYPGLTRISSLTEDETHGTHVAGTLAATPNNGNGITGVCAVDGVRLYACMNYSYITLSNAMGALKTLIADYGVKVINISQYTYTDAAVVAATHGNQEAIDAVSADATEATKYLSRLLDDGYEFLIVVAAGNQNTKVFYRCFLEEMEDFFKPSVAETYGFTTTKAFYTGDTPYTGADARYAHYLSAITDERIKSRIIVVGAADCDHNAADFSNVGSRVDIMAPGVRIYSCKANNRYGMMSGTSMAAPHVAGAAAMVFGCDPNLTGAQVKEILLATADYSYSYEGVYAGFLRADKAVELALGTRSDGLWSMIDCTFDELSSQVEDLTFYDSFDNPGHWFANGYYESASVFFEFDGNDVGDGTEIPVTMSIYSTNGEKVTVIDGVELGMEYYAVELLENAVVTRQDGSVIVVDYYPADGYGMSLHFQTVGLYSELTSVTVYRTRE